MADVRTRVLEATLICAGRSGLGRLTVEEVGREAGVGRATIYRRFPQGRDQLIGETVTWEVGRFFARLADEIDDAPDFRARLERGLMAAHRAVEAHEVLQNVLATDGERLVATIDAAMPVVHGAIRGYLEPFLAAERLQPGVDAHDAADHLARLVLSYVDSQGRWDLTDPASVRTLVDRQFLAGVLAP